MKEFKNIFSKAILRGCMKNIINALKADNIK